MQKKRLVKARKIGEEWVLEVLAVPYGAPDDLDEDGEYFSPETALHLDTFRNPPALYYHGYAPGGERSLRPEYIGQTIGHEKRRDGLWLRVLLDRASDLAKRVWEKAQQGLARASSGSIAHLVRVAEDGHILEWPLAEISLFDIGEGRRPANRHAVALPVLKAVYQQAGLDWPEVDLICSHSEAEMERRSAQSHTASSREGAEPQQKHSQSMEEIRMTGNENTSPALEGIRQIVADALKADREAQNAKASRAGRLPFNADNAPIVGKFGDLRRYDQMDAKDTAFAMEVMKAAGKKPSQNMAQALVLKLNEDQSDAAKATRFEYAARGIEMAAGVQIKADEVNYSTLASYGNEWASNVLYSRAVWDAVRHETRIAAQIPGIEIPQGYESVSIPLESDDPTFYKVAQVSSDAGAGGLSNPAPTVTSSQLGTANQSLALVKMGARVRYSAELEEDSIPLFSQMLRQQIERAAAEQFEHIIIDGDTATGASTNINDIAGTPAGNEAFLLADGFRKLALVTNTANSRDGGALDEDDFLFTRKLLGTAGMSAADPRKVFFIPDPNVYWKMLENITTVKTADLYPGAPSIESGVITNIWGSPVYPSASMHWTTRATSGYEYQVNTAGKNDLDTAANNTTGSLLAVRPDQWLIGYKRRMKLTVTARPEWDGYELVAIMRFGLIYRDNQAAAVSYNLTV